MNAVYDRQSETRGIWQRILVVLALVLLLCGAKNYLIFLARGTAWCPYVCPSAFGPQLLATLAPLQAFFELQWNLLEHLRGLAAFYLNDHWGIATRLVAAPLIEESLYRGPPFLLRRHSRRSWWWIGGLLLALLFALAHGRGGAALLPLFGLGAGGLWLIATTRRFWPAVMVHFLYNVYFTSVLLAGSLWASD